MTARIAGTGWVTPLGSDTGQVWARIVAGETAASEEVRDPLDAHPYPIYRVSKSALQQLPAHPRLRRASAISRFAAAAGTAALKDAALTEEQIGSGRLALIFAVANGGVIYTRRFYSDVVNTGADAASPLLFPETVFNAAASHLAAMVGLTGMTYTVVGDGAVGLIALKMAEDLLANPELDYCLVVGAEEADWLLCDACAKWRLLRSQPPIEPFSDGSNGTILSEGAGAVLLGQTGDVEMAATSAGEHFARRSDAPAALGRVLKGVMVGADPFVFGSANGTFVDAAEARALCEFSPGASVYSIKAALGEGVAASGLWQVVAAVESLRTQTAPPPHYKNSQRVLNEAGGAASGPGKEAIVLSCGMNQQVGATRLRLG